MDRWGRWMRSSRAVPAVLAGLALTACASVDATLSTARIAEAARAVDEAKQSNASLNAPAEIQAAEDKLIEARAAVTRDDYAGAVRLAEQAVVEAEHARARSDHERLRKMAEEMRQVGIMHHKLLDEQDRAEAHEHAAAPAQGHAQVAARGQRDQRQHDQRCGEADVGRQTDQPQCRPGRRRGYGATHPSDRSPPPRGAAMRRRYYAACGKCALISAFLTARSASRRRAPG